MENQSCAGDGQASLDFKCKKIISDVKKRASSSSSNSAIMESKKVLEEADVGSPTPPQIIQPSRVKQKGTSVPLRAAKQISGFFQLLDDNNFSEENSSHGQDVSMQDVRELNSSERKFLNFGEAELPEKYEALSNLFNRMDTSIRLLKLQKKLPSFSNISLQVEMLSKRKFSYQNLAQMKFIFPEAVMVEKTLVHDKHTSCMKSDLKISLVPAVELTSDDSLSIALCQTFRLRLLDFLNSHEEKSDIPEAVLPEPFNHLEYTVSSEATSQFFLPEKVISDPNLFLISQEMDNPGADLPHSQQSDCMKECSLTVGVSSSPLPEDAKELDPSMNLSHLPPDFREHFVKKTASDGEKAATSSSSTQFFETCDATNIRGSNFKQLSFDLAPSNTFGHFGSSPNSRVLDASPRNPTSTKLVSTPVVETPNLQVSKRPVLTPNDLTDTTNPPSNLSTTKRSLYFSASSDAPSDDEVHLSGGNSDKKASDHVNFFEESVGKEDPMMSQTGSTRSQMTLTCLLDLVNVVQLIFQKANFSSITKQELVHKIIWHSSEITDISEVEEQLQHLEDCVPDWLHRNMASSGDCFYHIKKTWDPVTVRQKIVESI